MVEFTTKDGDVKYGHIVHQYPAFEGGMRYVLSESADGKNYRCVKDNDGKFVELVI